MEYNQKKWGHSPEKIEALKVFFSLIRETKTFNKKNSEYSIKHLFANYANKFMGIDGYTMSDEFVYHAIQNGFKFKQIRTDNDDMPHGWLNMSEVDIQRIQRKIYK